MKWRLLLSAALLLPAVLAAPAAFQSPAPRPEWDDPSILHVNTEKPPDAVLRRP